MSLVDIQIHNKIHFIAESFEETFHLAIANVMIPTLETLLI